MVSESIPIPTEDHEQALFVQWFRRTYPGVLIFAIPNGGHRHIAVAAKLKATGAVKGVPDLYIPEWKTWVEMKRRKGGQLSPEQKEVIEYLRGIGDVVIIGRGFDDASAQIVEMMND